MSTSIVTPNIEVLDHADEVWIHFQSNEVMDLPGIRRQVEAAGGEAWDLVRQCKQRPLGYVRSNELGEQAAALLDEWWIRSKRR